MPKRKPGSTLKPPRAVQVVPYGTAWKIVGPVCRVVSTKAVAKAVARRLLKSKVNPCAAIPARERGAITPRASTAGLPLRTSPTKKMRRDDTFEADLDYLLKKNAELYRRLAR